MKNQFDARQVAVHTFDGLIEITGQLRLLTHALRVFILFPWFASLVGIVTNGPTTGGWIFVSIFLFTTLGWFFLHGTLKQWRRLHKYFLQYEQKIRSSG